MTKRPDSPAPGSPPESAPAALIEPIEQGRPAPTFELPDQDGKPHHLTDYLGRWVVLYFYPKDDTPGCTKEACHFRDSLSGLKEHNAVVLGVSPDDEKSHLKFAGKFSLGFTLLADVGAHVCQRYGVWREKKMFGKAYMGVARTTYLIDPHGKVVHRWDKVNVDQHVVQVIDTLDAHKNQA